MEDRQKRGLCYNCDEKYSRGHKCKEQKLFHIDVTSTEAENMPIEDIHEFENIDNNSPI